MVSSSKSCGRRSSAHQAGQAGLKVLYSEAKSLVSISVKTARKSHRTSLSHKVARKPLRLRAIFAVEVANLVRK